MLTHITENYKDLEGEALINALISDKTLAPKAVLMSAFNPEDVILASWITKAKPDFPILFLDTFKHFPETLRYVESVIKQLGLTGVRTMKPSEQLLQNSDPDGLMWQQNVNRCCWLRKVEPIERGINEGKFEILITGRRAEQTPEREDASIIEEDGQGRIKINPLMHWSKEQRDSFMEKNNLPHHPLYALGYPSIGCAPCTTPVFPGEHERAGRWRHTRLPAEGSNQSQTGKTECGLHVDSK